MNPNHFKLLCQILKNKMKTIKRQVQSVRSYGSDESTSKRTKVICESKYFNSSRLTSEFFAKRSCIQLAQSILGKIMCRKLADGIVLRGKIVETEAYLGVEDGACMSYKGRRTARTEPMFMPPGTCYVYFTYGMYHCFNLSSFGEGAAVLIRALEPLQGMDQMKQLRMKGNKKNPTKEVALKDLTNGPSKFCIAFDIDRFNINKLNVIDSDLIWVEKGDEVGSDEIVVSKRIGINNCGEWTHKPLRYFVLDNPFVSVRDKVAEANMQDKTS